MKKANVEKVMGQAAVKKVVADEGSSKSAKMKALFEGGLELKEIATLLDVRYNFVYNVLSNYITINGVEVEKKAAGAGKKDAIIKLFQEGKSNKEISVELKTNYNYVHQVLKAYKASKEDAASEVAATN